MKLKEINEGTLQVLELFGGIGAPRKALINLGAQHKSIDYVEWNEKAVRTYNAMFDNYYNPQSVVGYNLKPDILVHGSPCQDFSIAGKQYGGNTEDGTRSSLLFETIKIIEGFGGWKPRFVVWENVKNVLSKKMKGAFNSYLEDMERLGYTNSYRVLDARNFGIPQARERIFVVSVLGQQTFDFSRLANRQTAHINDFLERNVDEKYLMTQPSMIRKLPNAQDVWKFRALDIIEDYAYTITTRQDRCPNSGVVPLEDGRYRYLTELECWRLMGFDDNDYEAALKEHPTKGKMNYTLYHQAGNSIVVPILEEIFRVIMEDLKWNLKFG